MWSSMSLCSLSEVSLSIKDRLRSLLGLTELQHTLILSVISSLTASDPSEQHRETEQILTLPCSFKEALW